MPMNKVKRWIDSSDFKYNRDGLLSESFHSLSTSQMFAYISKEEKNNKQFSSEFLADYIDDIQMDKQLESNNAKNKSGTSLLSLYVDETHLNQKPHLTTSINSCQLNPYWEENAVFNNLSPYHSHNSLPDYIEESNKHYSKDEKILQKSSSSVSFDSRILPQHHTVIPHKLYISKDGHASSLPVLTPCVSNPIFARSFDLLQFSYDETTDSIEMATNSLDSHLTNNHGQKQSTEDNIDSGLNTGSRLDADSELNEGCINALQSSGYYESSFSNSKEIHSENANHDSTSDVSLRSPQSIDDSSSGIQGCDLGYFEHNIKCVCFDSRNSSRETSDFDIDNQNCDIAATSKINHYFTIDSPTTELGFMFSPNSTENLDRNQLKDINE